MSSPKSRSSRPAERQPRSRSRYQPPTLERLGDLRSLTLGSSPGIPDSGIGMPEQPQP